MDVNQAIDIAKQVTPVVPDHQQASIEQDNLAKTAFALDMLKRLSQQPPTPAPEAKIPSLGAMPIPS